MAQNDSTQFPHYVPNTGTCPGSCWLPSLSTDLRDSVQHLLVKASSSRFTAYFVTNVPPLYPCIRVVFPVGVVIQKPS